VKNACWIIKPLDTQPLQRAFLYVGLRMCWIFAGFGSSKISFHVSTEWSKKTDTQFYFWDNFSNSAPILTILSLLQAEIYGT